MTQPATAPLVATWRDALAGLGGPAVQVAFDDACILHIPGRSGLAGQYQGGEAILGVLRRRADLTDGTLHFAQARVLTADDHAMVLCGRATATRRGRRLDTDTMHVLALRDGKVREVWMFNQDQDRVDEFWTT